jgi:hypothetical protein
VLVLPFDLMDSTQKLQEVAKAADEAFGGAGIDFLVHNAGEGTHTAGVLQQQMLADRAFVFGDWVHPNRCSILRCLWVHGTCCRDGSGQAEACAGALAAVSLLQAPPSTRWHQTRQMQ